MAPFLTVSLLPRPIETTAPRVSTHKPNQRLIIQQVSISDFLSLIVTHPHRCFPTSPSSPRHLQPRSLGCCQRAACIFEGNLRSSQ